MKKKEIKFKLAELFSGPGGLALGAVRSFAENTNFIYRSLQKMLVDYRVQMVKANVFQS